MTVRVPRALTIKDPGVVAEAAGLTHVPDTVPGIRRRQHRDGFRYRRPDEHPPSLSDLERIETLAVPPAWTDVWISPSPDGYLQATGVDDAGRKQYRYHEDFRSFCDRQKFDRLLYFGRALTLIRKATERSLEQPLGSRHHAIAAAVRLIDQHLLRVGNTGSATNGHHGATTLTVAHLVEDRSDDGGDPGFVTLDYTAKSGQHRQIVVEDDDLADVLTTLAEDADDELFWFDDGPHGRRRADAADINRFIVEHAGPAFSAKDFRTWGGSRSAIHARAQGHDLLDAVDQAAADLGNTRAVARNSYIHPAVVAADQSVIDEAWRRSRSSRWLDRAESALVKVMASSTIA